MRIFLLALMHVALQVHAQPSPFNGLEPLPADSAGRYRIVIGGHFHGASNNTSGFPAASLLANLDTINALGARLLLSTGDLFLDADGDLERFRSALFSRLHMPLYNAPGNHDVEGSAYLEHFGPTHGTIDLGPDRVILLDTERHNGNLRDEQLALLEKQVDAGVRHLFIVSHRPVWSEDDPVYSPLFKGNTRSILPANYRKDVLPVLERIAAHSQVYWLSGSMSGRAPYSIFFQPHAPGITFIQSAIRDVPRDAVLIADVGEEGIQWWPLSLTGHPHPPVDQLGATQWADGMRSGREAFNWRLLPYLVRLTVTHRAFWWGAGAMLLLLLLVGRLYRRGL
jgi:hypothetical protein